MVPSSEGPRPLLSKTIIVSYPVKQMKGKKYVNQHGDEQLPDFARPSPVSTQFHLLH